MYYALRLNLDSQTALGWYTDFACSAAVSALMGRLPGWFQQLVWAEPQSSSEAIDVDETDIPPSPFATADVRTVKVSPIGKFLL